jgi:hypothetical protein
MLKEIVMKQIDILPALPEDAPLLSEISVAAKRYWGYPEEWMQKLKHLVFFAHPTLRQPALLVPAPGEAAGAPSQRRGKHGSILHVRSTPCG